LEKAIEKESIVINYTRNFQLYSLSSFYSVMKECLRGAKYRESNCV